MNLLLDTHILIWALNEDSMLPAKAKEMILDPGNAVYYSTVSIWEIAVKHFIRIISDFPVKNCRAFVLKLVICLLN